MKKEMPIIISILISILVYSIIGFAYMHSNFTTNAVTGLVIKQLDRIEADVKYLREHLIGD